MEQLETSLRLIVVHGVLDQIGPEGCGSKQTLTSKGAYHNDRHTYRYKTACKEDVSKLGPPPVRWPKGSMSLQCAAAGPLCFDHER